MRQRSIQLMLALLLTSCSASMSSNKNVHVDKAATLHTFYYSWYMSPEFDGRWWHWNHDVLSRYNTADTSKAPFPGGEDIGANYFPTLGPYSSSDPDVMERHADMLVEAGIDNVVLSWWGNESADAEAVRHFADVLYKYNLTFSFHVEPFYKDTGEFVAIIRNLHETFGEHAALYQIDGKPMYFLYDSNRLYPEQWQTLLTATGSATLRGTSLDAHFIGLWVHENHGIDLVDGGFDGFYSYFAVDGFVYGSTVKNWSKMAEFGQLNEMVFVPCVGPGYRDDRIRPWNTENTRNREAGSYYDTMFAAALSLQTADVAVTSFNEWHEGTQIESATPKQVGEYAYDNYLPLAEKYYIHRTRYWKTELENRHESGQQ